MEEKKDDCFCYTPEQFMEMFGTLTRQLNVNDMNVELQGFKVFSWLPMFWPQIYNFPIQPEDVIIATFPKSGTTWMQHMVHLIVTEDFEAANNISVDVRVPFIEFPHSLTPMALKELAERPAPRLMKTHLPATMLPKDAPRGKVICVYRNAKDAAVSFYYHYQLMHPPGMPFMTFDEFARKFIKGDVAFGPYPEHLKSYLDYQKDGNSMLLLQFEDVKKDARKVIRQVADYLGKKLSDEMVEKIYEATTFKSMQSNKATNYSEQLSRNNVPKEKKFIRKGIVGDWKNHFSDPKLLAEFDKYISENVPQELIFQDK